MTDKAYIVANKEQELELLKKFEEQGFLWKAGDNPTSFVPSKRFIFKENEFPYMMMITNDRIWWSVMKELEDEIIVYDGRKEESMYKVTQEFINELIEWRDSYNLDAKTSLSDAFVDGLSISEFPEVVEDWWVDLDDPIENNNRLIAIIKWLNGEDMFEIEEPHKFVIRTERVGAGGNYSYVELFNNMALLTDYEHATALDTREEAQEWANSHQVVVEIDAEGNEVE